MTSANSRQASGAAQWIAHFIAPLVALFAFATPQLSLAANNSFLPPPPATVATSAVYGDVNPYGVAFVPNILPQTSVLHPGDLLVANFNNNQNLQGTGATIIRVDGNGQASVFFHSSNAYTGLSAALVVLRDGTVVVGNLKTSDGTSNTAQPGALQFISPNGALLSVLADSTLIDGPWGMAANENGSSVQLFVSNLLNGTITRLSYQPAGQALALQQSTVIASGLSHRPDPAALELGPAGLLYDAAHDALYMSSSTDNAIYRIDNASSVGTNQASPSLIVQDFVHLHGPLMLAHAPNGDLLVADSDGSNADPNQPSEIVEYTTGGAFVSEFSIDSNNGGAFGIAVQHLGQLTRFATVDDNTASVTTWTKFDQ